MGRRLCVVGGHLLTNNGNPGSVGSDEDMAHLEQAN